MVPATAVPAIAVPAAAVKSLRDMWAEQSMIAAAEPSARLASLHGSVPPGTDAGLQLVISFDDLHRYPRPGLSGLDAHGARLGAAFRREPCAIVPPQARAFGALVRRPGGGIDAAAAPAVFDQEIRRAPG